jgi:hypothetical protein
MEFFQLVRGRWTDGGDPGSSQIAHIMKRFKEIFEEFRDPVWARKDQPIVRVQFQQRVHQILTSVRRLDPDRWDFKHFSREFSEF